MSQLTRTGYRSKYIVCMVGKFLCRTKDIHFFYDRLDNNIHSSERIKYNLNNN